MAPLRDLSGPGPGGPLTPSDAADKSECAAPQQTASFAHAAGSPLLSPGSPRGQTRRRERPRPARFPGTPRTEDSSATPPERSGPQPARRGPHVLAPGVGSTQVLRSTAPSAWAGRAAGRSGREGEAHVLGAVLVRQRRPSHLPPPPVSQGPEYAGQDRTRRGQTWRDPYASRARSACGRAGADHDERGRRRGLSLRADGGRRADWGRQGGPDRGPAGTPRPAGRRPT